MNRFTASLILASLAAASTVAARADVFNVTKIADTADGACNQDCSLREAVAAANAAAGADVILLPAGTYQLFDGSLALTDDLTLLGAAANATTVDGAGQSRVFEIEAGTRAELRDLAVRHGRSETTGAGILNEGTLRLVRCAVTDNVALGNGGGIANSGILTVQDSTLASNLAARGGGLYAAGTATLTNVTFSSNGATRDFGGGLYAIADVAVAANNTTFTGNSSANRGGGVYAEGSPFIGRNAARFSNSVIARNTGLFDPDCAGSPLSGGYNLVGQRTDCSDFSAAKHDLLGILAGPLDPKLGPFADNGGPTPTHQILAGSPAIEAGNPAAPGTVADSCAATDQRGIARPGAPGSRCDIGAFEVTTACVAGGGTLCLSQDRFRVTAAWQTAQGATGSGQGVELTPQTGYFWFFDPGNVELTVKVIDACALSNRFWVFASGLTNVKVDLTVVDTRTGRTKLYANPLNRTFAPILDTNAFTCQ